MEAHRLKHTVKLSSKKRHQVLIVILVVSWAYAYMCAPCLAVMGDGNPKQPDLLANTFNSGFEQSHDTYNGISVASDGKVYYVLCSESINIGAQMYSYDPATKSIKHLGDLTEASGEAGLKTIPQGKSHVRFVESKGKLYFATHTGYYTPVDGMEKMGVPPPGYRPYPGGHFLSYEMSTGKFENLSIAPFGEGILSMAMDAKRDRLYGITWPTGYFLEYDLLKKKLKNFGPISEQGENGRGPTYRTLCRSLVINPEDGAVFYTTSDGAIMRHSFDQDGVEKVQADNLKKDYFGVYDPTVPGHMGYNWRQTIWHDSDGLVYGVHGNSGYLFKFNPRDSSVEILDRITSEPSKKSGMFDQFTYGYLGFGLGPDSQTIYYLTGGPIYENGKLVRGNETLKVGSKGAENLHLITYHIPTGKYQDHGPIFYKDGQRPSYVNTIAIGKDGTIYTLARITENGRTRTDLISIAPVS